MIVEDDDDLRRMLRSALTFADFDVREAADGHTALAAIEQYQPAVIVLDMGLPTLSGEIVLQELAGQLHTQNIPVVVITGQDDVRYTEHMACLLRKPITPDRLVKTVHSCIASGSRPVV